MIFFTDLLNEQSPQCSEISVEQVIFDDFSLGHHLWEDVLARPCSLSPQPLFSHSYPTSSCAYQPFINVSPPANENPTTETPITTIEASTTKLILLNLSLIRTLLYNLLGINMVLLLMDHMMLILHMVLLLCTLPRLVLLPYMVILLHFILLQARYPPKQPQRCSLDPACMLWCYLILTMKGLGGYKRNRSNKYIFI